MAMANSWGLFLVIMFMGYGLVSVPRRLWFTGNPQKHLNQLYGNASRVKEECMDSELEFIEVCKASIPSLPSDCKSRMYILIWISFNRSCMPYQSVQQEPIPFYVVVSTRWSSDFLLSLIQNTPIVTIPFLCQEISPRIIWSSSTDAWLSLRGWKIES